MPKPRLYTNVPIFHQIVWTGCRNPHMGLVYEHGIHIQHQEVPLRYLTEIKHWIHRRKRHFPPTGQQHSLQCLCISKLHKTYGAKHIAHYRLCPRTHTPFIFFNRYTYHVYYRSITNKENSASLFVITLLVKYGVDFVAPIVQGCFINPDIVTDPALLRYSLYRIYQECQEFTCSCKECIIPGSRLYHMRCLCYTCQILNALYYIVRTSKRSYKRTLTS